MVVRRIIQRHLCRLQIKTNGTGPWMPRSSMEKLQWMLGRLENTMESGNWNFRYTGFDLAILDLDDFFY